MQRARKHLGQHFLHDPIVIGKLLTAIAPRRGENVVEIGGGRGALTRPLLDRLERLVVVELDGELAAELAAAEWGRDRLIVHHADALEFDYATLGAPLRVVGNLPYNISTPLLFRLLGYRAIISDMHLMLQKEVVERMTAAPGSKSYGRLTVMLSAWTEIEACFDIGPGAFQPPPQVWSSFVRIGVRTAPRYPIADQRRFAELVALLFSMRRKTIGRSLKGRLPAARIEAAGIDPRARAETLEPRQFAELAALEPEASR
jgi:16S rRNA (adenine1518-N6/adenine1519-N6)-dimethyltransferase